MRHLFLLLFLLFSAYPSKADEKQGGPDIQSQVGYITQVMYHDVTTPTGAARFYAYTMLTGYQVIAELDPSFPKIQGTLNQFHPDDIPVNKSFINKRLAVLYAMLETGINIIPSGYLLEEKQHLLVDAFKKDNISAAVMDSSIAFAKKVSAMIVQYAKDDGYFKLSTFPRYKPFNTDSSWEPTPPEYLAAIDPNWNTIRTFFLESPSQYIPARPVSFNINASSDFFKLTKEVYDVVNHLTPEQTLIANFWDCNPFAVQFEGHMSVGLKKISPGGHWMGITGIAAKKANLDFNRTMLLHTLVALTLHDAFISCWDEKYRSNRIRPETAINRYIDEKWKPILQTPPFPEYSSGHSVISTAAAEVLTYFLGDNFSFSDDTETYIGLPVREFASFRQAAAEARISRLYGGIHYRDAIEFGGKQGREIGNYIIQKLNLRPLYRN